MPTATADRADDARLLDRAEPGGACRDRLRHALTDSFPAASFVAFRVAFGLLVAFSHLRFLARGWVEELYLAPQHHLTYPGLGWVRPLPAPAMYAVVAGLALLGLLIAAGVRTRQAAGLFAVGFAYTELIEASLYLNHYWFVTLAAVVLATLPPPRRAGDGSLVVPGVNVWALRAQLGVVYFFAGLAKVNPDWLMRGEPLDTWLGARTDRPLIGPWLDEHLVALAFSWAGALFDLTIVGWLLWRRSRPWAYAVLVVFHVMTAMLFQIGVFPWVMITLTPIFFDPAWPSRLWSRITGTPRSASIAVPARSPVGRMTWVALGALAALNLFLPLRHWRNDGNVRWNDNGYLLAWRVMLTERTTHLQFDVVDPDTGDTWVVTSDAVLTEWQAATADTRPDLILATAHLIAADFADRGVEPVEVYADAHVAWNGRLRERWLDDTVDLAATSPWAPTSDYVLEAP